MQLSLARSPLERVICALRVREGYRTVPLLRGIMCPHEWTDEQCIVRIYGCPVSWYDYLWVCLFVCEQIATWSGKSTIVFVIVVVDHRFLWVISILDPPLLPCFIFCNQVFFSVKNSILNACVKIKQICHNSCCETKLQRELIDRALVNWGFRSFRAWGILVLALIEVGPVFWVAFIKSLSQGA